MVIIYFTKKNDQPNSWSFTFDPFLLLSVPFTGIKGLLTSCCDHYKTLCEQIDPILFPAGFTCHSILIYIMAKKYKKDGGEKYQNPKEKSNCK